MYNLFLIFCSSAVIVVAAIQFFGVVVITKGQKPKFHSFCKMSVGKNKNSYVCPVYFYTSLIIAGQDMN